MFGWDEFLGHVCLIILFDFFFNPMYMFPHGMFLLDTDMEHDSCHELMWEDDIEVAHMAIPS